MSDWLGPLLDAQGEIPWRIGDLFNFRSERGETVTLSIVLPERGEFSQRPGERVFCVRLYSGEFHHKGQRFQIEEGKNPPLFHFTEELVISCLRKQVNAPAPIESEPPAKKPGRQKTSKGEQSALFA